MKKNTAVATIISPLASSEKWMTFVRQVGNNEFEIFGSNISEHYTVRPSSVDEYQLDVVYLGVPPASTIHN